jgi:hypothetical protein
MNNFTASMENLWGEETARTGHARVPFILMKYCRELRLTSDEFFVVSWLIYHQRNKKPSWPHDSMICQLLGISNVELLEIYASLGARSLMIVEKTDKGDNHYKDLRLLFAAVNKLAKEHLRRIDASTNKRSYLTDTSTSIDTSIANPGASRVETVGVIMANRFKKTN